MTVLRPIRNQLLSNVDRREHLRLFYPRSWKMEPNPFSLAARRDAVEWFAKMGMVRDEGTRRLLAEERLALCGGYLFPTANFEQLETLVEFLGGWILLDDILLERSEGQGHKGEADLPGTEAPGATQQPAPAERARDLDHDEIGAMPAFHLIEYVGGFELPEEVRQHEVLRELHAIGSKLMLWAHDLINLENTPRAQEPQPMELLPEAGDLWDRAPALAMSRIVELHNQHVFKFLDVERALPDFGEQQPFVETYLQLMHYLIRGFAEWKLGVERRERTRPTGARRGSVSLSLSSFSEE
jgi:hypothetical protein